MLGLRVQCNYRCIAFRDPYALDKVSQSRPIESEHLFWTILDTALRGPKTRC